MFNRQIVFESTSDSNRFESTRKWFSLDEIDLFCGSAGSMDSFLTIKSEGRTILNLNDCVFNKNQYKYSATPLTVMNTYIGSNKINNINNIHEIIDINY